MSQSQSISFFSREDHTHTSIKQASASIASAIKSSSQAETSPFSEAFKTSLNPKFNAPSPKATLAKLKENIPHDNSSWLSTNAKEVSKASSIDYRNTETRVGDFILDPNQSRIQSALALGDSIYDISRSTIAHDYGINPVTISTAKPEQELEEHLEDLEELLGKEELDKDKEEDSEELGKDLKTLFDQVDKLEKEKKQETLEKKPSQNPVETFTMLPELF